MDKIWSWWDRLNRTGKIVVAGVAIVALFWILNNWIW